jgi:eukaryotic-like serine/threonine-protein kinase
MEFFYHSEHILDECVKRKLCDRYQILSQLGQGGNAITYAAKDLQTNQQVAIKVLSLNRLDDWKKIELFEREAKILQQLNHPAIPKYIDYFQIETKNDRAFCLVQQLAPGKSLATLIEEGWKSRYSTIKQSIMWFVN